MAKRRRVETSMLELEAKRLELERLRIQAEQEKNLRMHALEERKMKLQEDRMKREEEKNSFSASSEGDDVRSACAVVVACCMLLPQDHMNTATVELHFIPILATLAATLAMLHCYTDVAAAHP
jgi:hypothetical protein